MQMARLKKKLYSCAIGRNKIGGKGRKMRMKKSMEQLSKKITKKSQKWNNNVQTRKTPK